MTQQVGPIFGKSVDGSLTISVHTTDAPIDAAFTGTAGAFTGSGTNASFALDQMVLIHQTQGTNAGQWERNHIVSYSSGTITFSLPLAYTYTTGAQIIVLKQYSSITVNSGVTWTAKAWNGTTGGILATVCSGRVTVAGTISAMACGFRGGTGGVNTTVGQQGETITGTGSGSTSANGAGGGGGSNLGSNGSGGATLSDAADLTTMQLGPGGGGSNVPTGQTAVDGGRGGGIVAGWWRQLDVTGAITVNGQAAQSGYRASGAGAAGSLLVSIQEAIRLGTNLLTALGGTSSVSSNGGGTGGSAGHATAGTAGTSTTAGPGGNGRIAIAKCSVTDAGTTNPTYTDKGYQTYCGIIGRG